MDSSVLLLARRDEGFAETSRAAIVDRKDGIAAVGEPLVVAAIAVAVAGPGSAMDDKHHRQRFGWPIAFDVRRQRQIGDEIEPVARFRLHVMHRSKAIGSEYRARTEQFRQGLLVAIEQIVGSWLLRLVGHDDPATIVVRLALNTEFESVEPRLEQRKISGDGGGNVDPLLSRSGGSHCVDLIGRGMKHEFRAIRLGMLGDKCFVARHPVVPEIRSSVATDARMHEHTLVAPIEVTGPGRDVVFVGHIPPRHQRCPLDAPLLRTAVGGIAARMARPQMPIETDMAQLLRVFPDQRAPTGRKIDAIEVVPARITIVDLDGDIARSFQRPQAELDADVREWRDVTHGARNRIDNEQVMVLIARLVVEKHQEAAVRRPILPVDWPALRARHWLPSLDVTGRRHPHIEHAVHRRKPGDPAAIWRDFRAEERWVVEQCAARNE
jgi:hypothetical protein